MRKARRSVSITRSARKKFERIGNSLISRRATTGFQIEDHPARKTRHVYYGHSDSKHTSRIAKKAPGKKTRQYPRSSYYRWKKEWGKPSEGTVLVAKGRLAKEKGNYIRIRGNPTKIVRWLRKNATKKVRGK